MPSSLLSPSISPRVFLVIGTHTTVLSAGHAVQDGI